MGWNCCKMHIDYDIKYIILIIRLRKISISNIKLESSAFLYVTFTCSSLLPIVIYVEYLVLSISTEL